MDDVFYNTADVAIALSKVEVAETSRVFVVVGMRFELNLVSIESSFLLLFLGDVR